MGDPKAVTAALAFMDSDPDADGWLDPYTEAAAIVWDNLDGGQREVLRQLLFQGPVWDGNVPSKAARDDLIDWKLATRCCFMGEQGYTAATYRAYTVFKAGNGVPIRTKAGCPG